MNRNCSEQPPRRSKWVTGAATAALALVLAAGVAGPASAAAIPITAVRGQTVTVLAHNSASSVAECPSGLTAVSGGWSTASPGPVPGVSELISPTQWLVWFDNPTDSAVSAYAIVYCTP